MDTRYGVDGLDPDPAHVSIGSEETARAPILWLF
jgi:hypothetical protein